METRITTQLVCLQSPEPLFTFIFTLVLYNNRLLFLRIQYRALKHTVYLFYFSMLTSTPSTYVKWIFLDFKKRSAFFSKTAHSCSWSVHGLPTHPIQIKFPNNGQSLQPSDDSQARRSFILKIFFTIRKCLCGTEKRQSGWEVLPLYIWTLSRGTEVWSRVWECEVDRDQRTAQKKKKFGQVSEAHPSYAKPIGLP